MVKRRTKPEENTKAKKEIASVHIQARLHPDKVREADAVSVYQFLKNEKKLTDRVIVREALIAYGQMTDSGWQPQEEVNEVALTEGLLQMIKQMAGLVNKLATLDLSSARNHDGSAVNAEEFIRELSEFDKSASEMLGTAIFFDVEE